ncbi:MAG: hypothetical protein CR954_00280, partial [Candidatus Moraniibacteriota bacterium]
NAIDTRIKKINAQITEIRADITESKKDVQQLQQDITRIIKEIEQKQNYITLQKKMLSNFLREKYQNHTQDAQTITFLSAEHTDHTKQDDALTYATGSVGEYITKIKREQESLQKNKENLEKKKEEIKQEQKNLEHQSSSLRETKEYSQALLSQSELKEAKYQKKLKKIEKQKEAILGNLNALYSADIGSSIEKAPQKYHASTRWYYSQKDPRWAKETIGNSRSTIEDYGCALTSVAMVFTYHKSPISPKKMSNKPIFYWDLISWPQRWSSGITLASSIRHGSVDWDDIDDALDDDNPVIVFLNIKNGAGHYVVIHTKAKKGKYVVHDPYFGANIYLDSTVSALNKLYKRSVSTKRAVDQIIIYEKD